MQTINYQNFFSLQSLLFYFLEKLDVIATSRAKSKHGAAGL